MASWATFLALSLSLIQSTVSVDKNNFKTCDQSSFCKRNRALQPNETPYHVDPSSVVIEDTNCKMDLVNRKTKIVLVAEIFTLDDNMFRIKINEKDPIKKRYEVEGALIGEPKTRRCKVQRSSEGIHITSDTTEAKVTFDPFRIDLLINGEIAVVLNSRGLFNFEHYRTKVVKPTPTETPDDDNGDDDNDDDDDDGDEYVNEEGMWDERFKSHHDSKPHGPSSVGLDIAFPGVDDVYGIPEHADSFRLKSTSGSEPYRLFNLDVFEYELNSRMALYGSIPFMLAHNWSKTVGVFWNNAAETWIDITSSTANQNILGKLISMFKSDDEIPQTDTHWISESGIIDIFIILGPRPHDVFRQYSSLTGTTALPPLFSIAYHQCRWNYNDQDDVEFVNNQFDAHDIPYDVLWLDIEHTDGKKYFTWDGTRFSNSVEMQDNLAKSGRKMVTIIDPHIKRESGYHIHSEAQSKDLYVKKADGSVYEGHCWPGSSSWIDFLNPDIRLWWAQQFALDKYQGSTLNLFTWNDMNEPSVFNGPEVTMHKDAVHYGGWENRDVHNIYGMLMQQSTYEGHVMRGGGKQRPFVLSRAFFAGSQRHGAIWTGDNFAAWDHLQASIPMVLSVGVAGLPFVGADVGGFFKDPDQELLVRWYQTGIFYPFFRAHGHIDTKRREPYLLDEGNKLIVRDAIRLRYTLLPYIYTLFYHSHTTGMPVARPMWVEFPRDKNTYATEDQFALGSALVVRPVMEQGASSVQLYLPGSNKVWYDYHDYTVFNGGKQHMVTTPLSKIPLFIKGGSIVPTKQRIRRSSALTTNDPYTLVVALDGEGKAHGQLYIDDGLSFNYKHGEFSLRQLNFSDSQLTSSAHHSSGRYETKAWLERVIVIGYTHKPSSVTMTTDGRGSVNLRHTFNNNVLIIGKPGVNINDNFNINIS